MSWIATAIVGGAALGVGGAAIASSGARDAAETQALAAESAGQQQLALGREQLEATRPLRDLALEQAQFQFGLQQESAPQFQQAALGALPLLTEDINRQAGTGQPFERRSAQGARNIFSNLGAFGLEDSSVAGRAVGEFQSGLLSQDIENLQNQRFRLAGFSPQSPSFFGGGTAGLGLAGQTQQAGIQSLFGAGQSRAAGQLGSAQSLGGAFGTLGGFGLQFGLGSLLKGTGEVI